MQLKGLDRTKYALAHENAVGKHKIMTFYF